VREFYAEGIRYKLSHHGVSDYSPQGTWCFYVYLREEQFVSADDFARFDREPVVKEFAGSHRQSYDYFDVPDHGFHGGITWYERTVQITKSGAPTKVLEIGCDYNHSWDRDEGYWQGLDDVERDAKALIDALVADVPMKDRCAYSGKYDLPCAFYTARNGSRIHISQLAKFSETEWPMWLPATDTEAALSSPEALKGEG
jgi:hypothetical protein